MKINECKKEIKLLSCQDKDTVSGGLGTWDVLGYAGLFFTAATFSYVSNTAYYGPGGAGDKRPAPTNRR
ncbi:hypothetical protein ACPF4H_003400 [Vibrio cholerae]